MKPTFQLHRYIKHSANHILCEDDRHLDDLHHDLPPPRSGSPHLQGDLEVEADPVRGPLWWRLFSFSFHKSWADETSWPNQLAEERGAQVCWKVKVISEDLMFRARLKRRMRFCENLLDKVLPFAAAGSYVTIRPSVPSIPHFQVYTILSIQIFEVYTISSIQIS